MIDQVKNEIRRGRTEMDDAMEHLSRELKRIRTGKASVDMLDDVKVDYYGTPSPISQVGNLSTTDSRTLVIQPWDKGLIGDIEQAIFAANLGLTPQNDGEVIRISIPPLTEDRRKDLVRQGKSLGEESKVSLRSTRHKLMDFIKKAIKDGLSEDLGKRQSDIVDGLTKEYYDKVDKHIEAKEKDIMTI